MDRETLKAVQAPLKQQYQEDPKSAIAILHAEGTVDFHSLGCRVALPCNNGREIIAGLHPKAGGDGAHACSGDMLLQALVTCAGTTLAAVSISMGLKIEEAKLEATGLMDFRGTLGVDRTAPIGLTSIDLQFSIRADADSEQIQKLLVILLLNDLCRP